MDEKELFNKDVMYWREVNAVSSGLIAEIELNETVEVDGEHLTKIDCSLLPFESTEVIYELENGGAFKKNEVKLWPFVRLNDLEYYQDEANSEEKRKNKVHSISHGSVQSITLKDNKGNVILTKAKI